MVAQNLEVWQNEIARVKDTFIAINNVNNYVNYKSEIMFATQIIGNNDYLAKIANNNPASLRAAVINIASIGLSLNPATKYAYLVPRDGAACLDISYIGLIKLATDTGSILWARAEIVREKDLFIYKGAVEKPEFSTPEPFNRGEMVGVYCVAKTVEGDYLSGIMDIKEINDIKNRSKAAVKNSGPWITDFYEMCKKAIIKRESKTWPKTDKSERFDNAIEVVNQHSGIDFTEKPDINLQKVEEAYLKIVNTITTDSGEEEDFLSVQAEFRSLNNNEQMTLNDKLRKYKPPGSRQYNTLLKEYLSYKKVEIID